MAQGMPWPQLQGDGGKRAVRKQTNLLETDDGSLLPEALSADVHAVLSDQTGLVGADSALSGTLSKGSGSGEPNGLVRH